METRSILHLDMDSFFVSVERLKNSALAGKPILIGGSSNRGVVACCSYETRRFGVRSAMPMRMARRLCPEALVIRGDMESYTNYSNLVTQIIQEKAPIYEKSSIDEFYLDLTGMDRIFGCFKWSVELKHQIFKESGLPVTWGLSVNKLVSKVGAGEAKPDGQIHVGAGTEKDFLAPLSVTRLPGVGKQTAVQLVSMGVKKIHTLREVPLKLLEYEFGKHGTGLWKKANAMDDSPVEPYREQKSMSTERTFQVDTTDTAMLHAVLVGMTEKLSFQLRKINRMTACVAVKIRYSDFNTYTNQVHIPYTAQEEILISHVLELFRKLYNRRMLIRLIGIRFSKLVQGNHQMDIFDDNFRKVDLYRAIDRMRNRFGPNAVKRAISSSV